MRTLEMNFVSNIHNKENISQPAKRPTKSMNFGKQVKYKAHIDCFQSPPLKESILMEKKGQPRMSEDVGRGEKMALFRSPSFEEEDSCFKLKMVRFEDEQKFGDISQISCQSNAAKKKNQSILKKTPSSDNLSVNSGTSDMGQIDSLNAKSSLRDKGTNCSNDKYVEQVKMLKYENSKFTDRLFPPGSASLCYSKDKMSKFREVKWMRIEEVFRGKKLAIYNRQSHYKCIYNYGPLAFGHNIAKACNSLANSNRCLQRIFEEQKLFGLCIYYLRINNDGIWKYVVIDDHIPVVREGNNDVPAFMRILENQAGEIQVWPLLLSKALAKIYGSYEAIFDDQVQNLLYDMTGFPCQFINLPDPDSEYQYRNSVTTNQTVSILHGPYNDEYFSSQSYPIREEVGLTASTFFCMDSRMKLMDLQKYNNILIDVVDLKREFKFASLFSIIDSYYSLGCVIKQNRNSISLRRFQVKERGMNCILSLVQKDRKYFHNNGYDYVWSRIMVVVKDGANGYRWIAGQYEKTKVNSLRLSLDPGQYLVLVSGDWQKRVFEMTLNYQGSQEISFERQAIDKHPNIISQTCTDLAQRFGKLAQLNKRLCAYRLVDRKNGFIIENINNEVNRNVVFYKQYHLTGNNFQILNQSEKEHSQDQQNLIQIKIKPNSYFTFIAKLINGGDQKLLQGFMF